MATTNHPLTLSVGTTKTPAWATHLVSLLLAGIPIVLSIWRPHHTLTTAQSQALATSLGLIAAAAVQVAGQIRAFLEKRESLLAAASGIVGDVQTVSRTSEIETHLQAIEKHIDTFAKAHDGRVAKINPVVLRGHLKIDEAPPVDATGATTPAVTIKPTPTPEPEPAAETAAASPDTAAPAPVASTPDTAPAPSSGPVVVPSVSV